MDQAGWKRWWPGVVVVVGLLGFNRVLSGQNILSETHSELPGLFPPSLFFTVIVSQLWSISLLKMSCCVFTKDTRSLVWMGAVLTIFAEDRFIISKPGKMTLQ